MILNTVLKPGRVNTLMTMPRTPGAMMKRSSVLGQMVDQRAVELGLAMLVEADRGVQLGDVLARQDALQESRRTPPEPATSTMK